MSLLLLLVTLFAPRVAFVAEVCHFADFCPAATNNPDSPLHRFAKLLHIGHSRHLLQIVCYVWFGGTAFFAMLSQAKKPAAFLWFWLTAALGIYSYVGEKVPWLTTYIVLPMILLVGFELTRVVTSPSLRLRASAVLWLTISVPFTIFKSLRLSFMDAANPVERMVFTQTTPATLEVMQRFSAAAPQAVNNNIRVTMFGEATWPVAWYVQKFKGYNFIQPTPEQADRDFDAFFVDSTTDVRDLANRYPSFAIYQMPLRHWWVPKPDPSFSEILAYFLWREPYGGPTPGTQGFGDTSVYYLERTDSNSPFKTLPPPKLARPTP